MCMDVVRVVPLVLCVGTIAVPFLCSWALTCELVVVPDDPTRIHTLRNYIEQAKDKTSVEFVRAKQ